MTVREFSLEFDLAYNNIAGASAPPIDIYEKSVYLTTAQEQLIKNKYDPTSNQKQRGFEQSEKRRSDLKQLITDYKTSEQFHNNTNITTNARFFNLPTDIFLIVNEQVFIESNDCYNGNIINVRPVTYDEYNKQIDNPFKTPDERLAWRLDFKNINENKVVEILFPYNDSRNLQYRLRYIRFPKPIILGNLNTLFPNDSLSINGEFNTRECELEESVHREILDRAVELALRDYKLDNLESKIQLDTRNE